MGLNTAMKTASQSITLAIAFCVAVGPAAAKERIFDGWKIMSGQSSAGGEYCTVQEDDKQSYIAVQAMLDGKFTFAAMSTSWQWTVGQRYRSTWKVANGVEWSGEALAIQPTTVILNAAPYPNPIDSLAAGKSMTVTVAGAEEGFSLKNFGSASMVLKRCLAKQGEFATENAQVALPAKAPIVSFVPPAGWTAVEVDDNSRMFVAPDEKGFIAAWTGREESWPAGVKAFMDDYKTRGFVFDDKLVREPSPGRVGGLENMFMTYGMRQGETRAYLTVNAVNLGNERVLVIIGGSILPGGSKWNDVYPPFYASVKKLN